MSTEIKCYSVTFPCLYQQRFHILVQLYLVFIAQSKLSEKQLILHCEI
jgi:hypothetical protein